MNSLDFVTEKLALTHRVNRASTFMYILGFHISHRACKEEYLMVNLGYRHNFSIKKRCGYSLDMLRTGTSNEYP